ncbi:MAG: aspartate kinase [Bernardetiaceae bacterium]|nr:aspartate kinase [Bernardetiaceae bacterium]
MKVLKFGGTSVGSAQRIKNVEKLINNGETNLVVLSAMSGTTNALVKIGEQLYAKEFGPARQLIEELFAKYQNVVHELYADETARSKAVSFINTRFDGMRALCKNRFNSRREKELLAEGEIISTHLMQFYLEEMKVPSVLLDALDFMRIDENDEPELDYLAQNLARELAKHPQHHLFITQGYICLNADGDVDNLKRGGSDYTASLVGAALQVDEIQIWTDIDGMHNNDPRIVNRTVPVAQLSFDEAAELAYFGAKILHPQSVNPARLKNVPVCLLNTMAPEQPGTVISSQSTGAGVKAVAAKDGITALHIQSDRMLLAYGFLKSLFNVFEAYKTPIDLITTSEVAVSVTIDNAANLPQILADLKAFSRVQVQENQTIVCIVGDMISQQDEHLGRIFQALSQLPVRMVSYGGSKNNVSVLVETPHKNAVLQALNRDLFGL